MSFLYIFITGIRFMPSYWGLHLIYVLTSNFCFLFFSPSKAKSTPISPIVKPVPLLSSIISNETQHTKYFSMFMVIEFIYIFTQTVLFLITNQTFLFFYFHFFFLPYIISAWNMKKIAPPNLTKTAQLLKTNSQPSFKGRMRWYPWRKA